MTRQARVNLALALLAAGLALFVWLDQRPPAQAPAAITGLDPKRIQRVRILRPDAEILLQRATDGWRMEKPQEAPADGAQVEALLAIAAAYSLERIPAPADRLAEFGLAPPSVTLDLDQLRIEVGGTQPVSHQRYLRIGDTIHLINDRFPLLLQAPAERYLRGAR